MCLQRDSLWFGWVLPASWWAWGTWSIWRRGPGSPCRSTARCPAAPSPCSTSGRPCCVPRSAAAPDPTAYTDTCRRHPGEHELSWQIVWKSHTNLSETDSVCWLIDWLIDNFDLNDLWHFHMYSRKMDVQNNMLLCYIVLNFFLCSINFSWKTATHFRSLLWLLSFSHWWKSKLNSPEIYLILSEKTTEPRAWNSLSTLTFHIFVDAPNFSNTWKTVLVPLRFIFNHIPLQPCVGGLWDIWSTAECCWLIQSLLWAGMVGFVVSRSSVMSWEASVAAAGVCVLLIKLILKGILRTNNYKELNWLSCQKKTCLYCFHAITTPQV